MNATQLYHELKQRNVELWCQGKMLRFRAPEGVLDEATIAQLRMHKKELIELIRGESEQSTASVTQLLPTTIGQQAMYFLHLSAPYSPAYNVASAFRVRSKVDLDAVKQTMQQLIERHDSLRSTMEMNGGELRRRVHASVPNDFAFVDTSGLDEDTLRGLVHAEYERPFDLASGPLIRTRVFGSGPEDFVFLITLHHIVFDAWSLWILQDELHKIYAANVQKVDPELPSLASNFEEFVLEQTRLIESERGKELLDYWRGELANDLPTLELPLDFPRPKRPALKGASHKFRLPAQLTQSLRDVAKSLRVTPFALTLSIFKVLLHRLSGQDDIVVGTTTSGRPRSEFTQVVGYFVNTLALRTQFRHDLHFAEFAGHVKEKVIGAIRNQDYPFAALVDRVSTRRVSGHAPICSAMFGLQKPRYGEVARLFNESGESVEVGDWSMEPFELNQQEGQFDLTLELFETEDSFIGLLKYDSELFTPETAERMSEQYLTLASQVAIDPHRPIGDYDLLTPADRHQLLEFSRGTSLPEHGLQTAHGLFETQAKRTPDLIAIRCNDRHWTFDELNRRSNRFARLLIGQGVRAGDLVACCFARGIETPVAILGIMKAGAAYLPLDTSNPPHRLAKLIRDSGAKLVLVAEDLPIGEEVEFVVPLLSLEESEALSALLSDDDIPENLERAQAANLPAYVLYTSGSTGTPKGVVVSHRAFCDHIVSIRETFGLRSDDRVLQFSNLTFDPSLEQMFAPWSLGATVVMRGNELWSPEVLCETVQKERLTVINLPPAYFKHCVASLHDKQHESTIRLVILGGDVFPSESIASFQNKSVRVLNAYGPTEAVITSTTYDVTKHGLGTRSVPIGKPKPGSRAYVLDTSGRMAPVGVTGRLFLAGSMLADGYLNDPELTEGKFVPDLFASDYGDSASATMYDTGDLARWSASGDLEFLGRADRQLKIHGMRVERGEIEAAIRGCEGVQNCHVDVRLCGEQLELVSWVELDKNCPSHANVNESTLTKTMQSLVPKYMIPRQWLMVDQLPVNSSGKIDTHRLPEPTSELRRTGTAEYVPPKTPWQTKLANIWSEELNVSPVGVEDNFFDVGGASLSSLRIVSRMNQEGLNPSSEPLKPEFLFEFQTIQQLSERLGISNDSLPAGMPMACASSAAKNNVNA